MNFQFDEGLWGEEKKKKREKDHLVVACFAFSADCLTI
jgi:protoheme ferro-lyase